LGGSVPSLLSSDAASCLTVAERIIALGTHDGTVHLLDFQGNQVLSPPPPPISLSFSLSFFLFFLLWLVYWVHISTFVGYIASACCSYI
jgi:hypothetical protein